jgi:N-succinyldiaminopimelate aminotransferase
MPRAFAQRVTRLAPNAFTAMTMLAQQHGAVNLGQGFPDFEPPAFVLEAARKALEPGAWQQYVPPRGMPRLLHAIALSLEATLGYLPDAPEEITVTVGATQALHAALQTILEPGDEVIILEPRFDSYSPQVLLCDGVPVRVPLEVIGGAWSLDLERVRSVVTPRTRAIIVNTPHNPTGKVFTRAELEGIAGIALEHDLWIIADEVYDRLVFEGEHVSLAGLPGMRERTVTIGSAGKIFSVTGWRVGWAVAPSAFSAALRAGHQWVPFCVSVPIQEAVAVALETARTNGYDAALRNQLRGARDLFIPVLERAGFDVLEPSGGYFVIADCTPLGVDAVDFSKRLVTEVGVAAMPVPLFHDADTRHGAVNALRFAFCKRTQTLEAAAERLQHIERALPASRAR